MTRLILMRIETLATGQFCIIETREKPDSI